MVDKPWPPEVAHTQSIRNSEPGTKFTCSLRLQSFAGFAQLSSRGPYKYKCNIRSSLYLFSVLAINTNISLVCFPPVFILFFFMSYKKHCRASETRIYFEN